jgi:hypothetical protein
MEADESPEEYGWPENGRKGRKCWIAAEWRD